MKKATVDREQAKAAFNAYVAAYDTENPRIALKAGHTLRVAELCERIAEAAGLPQPGVDLAWLCGILHDLGRFEQVRRWDTFRDALSVSHAALAVDILFGNAGRLADDSLANASAATAARADDERFFEHARTAGSIRSFIEDTDADEIIRAAVAHHSDFHLPDELDPRARVFCDVLRDADKLDILRVSVNDTPETVLGVSADELLDSTVSPAAEDAFFEHRTVEYARCASPLDRLVNLSCFAYELAFPASLEIAADDDLVFQPLERPFGIMEPFRDPATRFLLNRMDGHLRIWVDERL